MARFIPLDLVAGKEHLMTSNLSEKFIHGEVVVNAGLKEVWKAWTTEAGVKTFFAPECNIDLRPDGPYEIFFNLDAPPGERGGEGLRVLAVQPMQMFSFTWNAPPSLPQVRGQRTHVIIRFSAEDDERTRVSLYHDGWGTGGEWDEAYEYFNRAWNEVVLPRLKYRFEKGSVDWENPPDMDALSKMVD
ncbi:MAG: SRPBCC domain-containing protein [Anaerolineales bacterium]|nr:SRPBCC domain-containing protein [Anaerolineales bacterium]